jgi:glycosyltransferase involved in cell wall biosynthesis
VRRFGAGAVVPAGDVDAMAEAVRVLVEDPDALARARQGAEAARRELTWDASGAEHLALYRELA